ncbi:hypothetical protein HY095_03895 [Candidatus Micrarchaeota archaeon]|nr:hypothetical protein [Candidatus Micrarchaeota archaeon]
MDGETPTEEEKRAKGPPQTQLANPACEQPPAQPQSSGEAQQSAPTPPAAEPQPAPAPRPTGQIQPTQNQQAAAQNQTPIQPLSPNAPQTQPPAASNALQTQPPQSEPRPTIPAIAEQVKEENESLTVLEKSLLDEMHKRGEITKEEKDRIEREAVERKKLRPKSTAKPRVTHVKRTAVRRTRTNPAAEPTAAPTPLQNEEAEGTAREDAALNEEETQLPQDQRQAPPTAPAQNHEPPAASRKKTAPATVLEEAPLPQTPMNEGELDEIKAAELPRETPPTARPRVISAGKAQTQSPQQPQPQQPYRQAGQLQAPPQPQSQQTPAVPQPQAQPRQTQAASEGAPGPRVVEERDYSMLVGRRPLARGEMVNGRPLDYQSELERRKREQASRDALPLQPGAGEPLVMDDATRKQREVELAIKIDEENRRKRSLVSKIRGLLHI